MKKDFFRYKIAISKVVKLNRIHMEHAIVLLIGALLLTNLVLSLKVLFG